MFEEYEKNFLFKAFASSEKNIAVIDSLGIITYVNDSFSRRTAYDKEELLGSKISILKSGVHGKEFYENLWKTIQNNDIYNVIFTNKNKQGELYHCDQTIIPICDNSDVKYYLVIGKDLSQGIVDELKDFI